MRGDLPFAKSGKENPPSQRKWTFRHRCIRMLSNRLWTDAPPRAHPNLANWDNLSSIQGGKLEKNTKNYLQYSQSVHHLHA